jgi:murein DD-endopeptidase MepM/ murein hydrolase activator NlpD
MFQRQKLYYFCEKTLTYRPLEKVKSKYFLRILSIFFSFVFFLFVINLISGNVIGDFFYNVLQYAKKNIVISRNISYLNDRVDSLQTQINRLFSTDKNLRLMVNLPIVENDVKQLGVGGSITNVDVNYNYDVEFSSIEDIEKCIDKISRQINLQKGSFSEILDKYKDDQKLFECIPAIIPMQGTYDKNSFGMRKHPILGYYKMHEGVDVISSDGTPIYAAGKGIVEKIGYDGGYGLTLEINHGYGYKSVYAHLSAVNVSYGDMIARGQRIAECGHSGLTTGPHLHYEIILNGVKLDPVNFFLDPGYAHSSEPISKN